MLSRRFQSVVLLIALAVATAVVADDLYSAQYDYVDVVAILNDSVLRDQYYNCFMDKAPCATPDAKYFQGIMPEAAVTSCRKCTEKQKKNFAAIGEWFSKNEPERWNAFIQKATADATKAGILLSQN